MKKPLFFSLFLLALFTNTYSQQDVKINAFGLIYGNYGGSFEYVVNKNASFNISGSYFDAPKVIEEALSTPYTELSFSLEYKTFFQKKENFATGFWGAPYFKYSRQTFDGVPVLGNILNIIDIDTKIKKTIFDNYAIGYCIGSKYIIPSGFIYEWYVGFGGYLGKKAYYLTVKDEHIDIDGEQKRLQMRLGFNIGYRFGGK